MSAAKYTQDGTEEGGAAKPSAEAGRRCVRSIQQHPVLSVEWMRLSDALRQLARLVQVEGRLPSDSKVLETAGRNLDSDGTLWDQEAQENAIRILVEEAKVSVCVRLLNDFKRWQYDSVASAATIEQAKQHSEFSETQIVAKCREFEESMGLLLWRAVNHVETVQLMDVPLFIEHCWMVLTHCAAQAPTEALAPRSQEVLVVCYVASLFRHAEAVSSRELLPKARELRLLPLAVQHMIAQKGENGIITLPDEVGLHFASGFAELCDNEDFNSDWPSYFDGPGGSPDRDVMAAFLELKPALVDPIIAATPEKKRELRPLLDLFNAVSRKM